MFVLLKFSEKITVGAAEATCLVVANPEANTPSAPTNANMMRVEDRLNMPESYS
jgi:hypothetical protein